MAKHILKILGCSQPKIFKVCLAIFQHYERKGSEKSQTIPRKKKHERGF